MAATPPPVHRCALLPTPWAGVHAVQTDSARHFGRHVHYTFGIGLLERGGQRSASGRGEVQALAGDLLAHNPGEVHDGRPLLGAPRRWWMLHLEPGQLAEWGGSPLRPDALELAQPVMRDPLLLQALQSLFGRLARWQARPALQQAQALACEEALARCCHQLLAAHASRVMPQPAKVEEAALQAVRDRLADTGMPAPSLGELATLAGSSRFQLLRRFTRRHGLPPHAWLLQQRLEQARRLVRDGQGLAEAALQAGFADQSHMTRLFSRQFGYTPGAWQQAAARRPRPA